jgi:hypothetical protein
MKTGEHPLDWDIPGVMRVTAWPRWARRLFVVTAPVSIPLWIILWPTLFVLKLILFVLFLISLHLVEVWRGDEHPEPKGDDE